ncbi:MAG TPA: hypothetical protein VGF39_09515 [Stellaceae bacterium]|jgi:hypothetical protein
MNDTPLRQAMDAADASLQLEHHIIRDTAEHAIAGELQLRQRPRLALPVDSQRHQADSDAALADAVEAVARQRARLSRKICSRHDAETIRRIHELLRGMLAETADPGMNDEERKP